MHTTPIRVAALASLFVAGLAAAGAPQMQRATSPIDAAVARALSADPAISKAGIAALRAAGQPGVDAILRDPRASKATVDQVCEQFDCATSRLYWHTDLDAAKAAAAAQGKPILSLRLLGNLDEELSCANSRFFRTTLYPNAALNEILRKDFVLHWESVRPVPKVTIDFGDGRRLERTLTGNSIHYVLDSNGRPVDAIPGLYGAKAFSAQITRAGTLAAKTASLDGGARRAALRDFHGKRLDAIATEWSRDLDKLGVATPKTTGADRFAALDKASEGHWNEIAARHAADAELDPASVRAVRPNMPPPAFDAGRIAVTKSRSENPILRSVDQPGTDSLQRSILLDGVKNEFTLHPTLHRWFLEGTAPEDLRQLNEQVYEKLFLMPLSDPWLGLSPPDAFSGITRDGRTATR